MDAQQGLVDVVDGAFFAQGDRISQKRGHYNVRYYGIITPITMVYGIYNYSYWGL